MPKSADTDTSAKAQHQTNSPSSDHRMLVQDLTHIIYEARMEVSLLCDKQFVSDVYIVATHSYLSQLMISPSLQFALSVCRRAQA